MFMFLDDKKSDKFSDIEEIIINKDDEISTNSNFNPLGMVDLSLVEEEYTEYSESLLTLWLFI